MTPARPNRTRRQIVRDWRDAMKGAVMAKALADIAVVISVYRAGAETPQGALSTINASVEEAVMECGRLSALSDSAAVEEMARHRAGGPV